MFGNPDTALPFPLESGDSLAQKLLRYRDRAHRAHCVTAANQVVKTLAAMDIKALIYGDLTRQEEEFTSKSGIDICIIDDPGFHSHSGPLFHQIQEAIHAAALGLPIDFVFLSCMPPEMVQHILRTGCPRVD